ncbi:MAG: InlB B-repeat-containing protein [Acutalibacteraceae bacterium]|nr:InlB B-repeat-containing protein [Acutalibacteraceae bacterium]
MCIFFGKLKKRITAMLCTLIMLIGVVYVPVFSSAVAPAVTVTEDTAEIFDFETTVTALENKEAYDNDGYGFYGFGSSVNNAKGESNNKVWVAERITENNETWATAGAYRLNKKVDNVAQVYRLEAGCTYTLTMKIRVISAPRHFDDTVRSSFVKLGYGTKKSGGDAGNRVTHMDNVILEIVNSESGSSTYTLTDSYGSHQMAYGEEWQTLSLDFTTPSAFNAGTDTALSFYVASRPDFRCEIDDVTVMKLASTSSIIVINDEYNNQRDYLLGKAGDIVDLSEITSAVEKRSEYEFAGFTSDVERESDITSLSFTDEKQMIYTKWKAPVSILLNDTHNGIQTEIKGIPGEKIDLGEEPFDLINDPDEKWFMGWYTTTACTEEFNETVFGYSNITLYSYWKARIPSLYQDFENYDKDYWEKSADGRKSNIYYFGYAMEKQSEVTAGEHSKYAVKFNWDSSMVPDYANNPSSYDAAARYNQADSMIWLGNNLTNQENYVVTFKYKVEKADTQVRFSIASARTSSIFVDHKRFDGKYMTLSDDGQWHEYTVNFKPEFKTELGNTIYLLCYMKQNADVTLYIDDVKIEPVAQPGEIVFYKDTGLGEPTATVMLRGEKLDLTLPVHPGGAEFLGWYADPEFTTPLTAAVAGKENINAYAKWSKVAVTFNGDYPYDTSNYDIFGNKMEFVNQKGIGVADDFALRFTFNGKDIYTPADKTESGQPEYMYVRAGMPENCFKIAEFQAGKTYKVTFNYRSGDDCKTDYSLKLNIARPYNIWSDRQENIAKTVEVKASDKEWKTYTAYFNVVPDKETATGLFVRVYCNNKQLDTYVQVLFDNVLVEEITAPYLFLNTGSTESDIVRGKVGEDIKLPTPTRFGYTFNGWYTDEQCKTPFTLKKFEAGTEGTIYAGWTALDSVTYSFENYNFSPNTSNPAIGGGAVIESGVADSGNKSVHFDRTVDDYNKGASYMAIAEGDEIFALDFDRQYVVTINYNISKAPAGPLWGDPLKIWFRASNENFWAGKEVSAKTSITYVAAQSTAGRWVSESFVLDLTSAAEKGATYNKLYLVLQGADKWDFYIDDITVTTIPKGKTVVTVNNGGCKVLPDVIIGNKGENFASKLPESPQVKGKYFLGYYTKNSVGVFEKIKTEDMKLTDKIYTIYARYIDSKVTENFDTGKYIEESSTFSNTYSFYDFGYEIYDSLAIGNSRENVTSGRYSLHRKCSDRYLGNAIILTLANQIAEGQRYTVSFKVKLGEHLHTDGAIKIASNSSAWYSWSVMGDYHPVVAIKDLKEGEWTEVSYTFNSLEPYFIVQTPGYVEVFMDDFVFTVVDNDTPVSSPVSFTEYVPLRRDADGNVIDTQDTAVDVNSIIDNSLIGGINEKADNNIIIIAVVCGTAVVLSALIILLLIKKKKHKA